MLRSSNLDPAKPVRRIYRALIAGLLPLVFYGAAIGQQKAPIDPNQLVRDTVHNELKPGNDDRRFMYKDTTENKKGTIVKEVINTPQGPLSRTIAINGRPLTADQRAKEDARLEKFANDPEARRKKQQSDKEESQREDLMVKTLPEAFVYTYAGSQHGPNGGETIHLTFRPNPNFNPPNHETQVYLGMQGDMYIDGRAKRLVKMDGTLFKEVNFGWGILGKLDPGGKFVIEQADIGDGVWDTTSQVLHFTGKILMIKSLEVESKDTITDFRPVPSQMTTAEALKLLQGDDSVASQNGGGVREAEKHK